MYLFVSLGVMKKIWKILIVVAVVLVLGVFAATCPGKQRHTDAIVKMMCDRIHDQAVTAAKASNVDQEQQKFLDELEQQLVGQIKTLFPDMLVYKNCVFFSLTRLEDPKEGNLTTSVGFLGIISVRKKYMETSFNVNAN